MLKSLRDSLHDIANLKLELERSALLNGTDISSCYPALDVDREITIEDLFELEEFL